jgi:hypothetical protein
MTHAYFFLCFWELSLRHSGNARKVTTIFYTVRYCVLPWDVLIHFTHRSTQQPALLAILNILTSFQRLDQNVASISHFLKHAAIPTRLSCLFRRYKYRPKVFGSYLNIYLFLQYHRNIGTGSKTARKNLGPQLMFCVADVRTVVHFAKPTSENKLTLVVCVCVCVYVCAVRGGKE